MSTSYQDYDFTSQGYLSYDKARNGLIITQKKDPKEYAQLLERMKAIRMEFRRGQLKNLSEENANLLIEKITSYGNFEYFDIEYGGKVSKLPRNLMNHSLKRLNINVTGVIDLSDVLPLLKNLEKLVVRAKKVITGDFSTLQHLESVSIYAEEWVDDFQIETIKHTQNLHIGVDKFKHQQFEFTKFTRLEALIIQTDTINLQKFDPPQPSLIVTLKLNANKIEGIENCFKLDQLQRLVIEGDIGETLPNHRFEKLRSLTLNLPNCQTINIQKMNKLEEFTFHVPSSLKSFDTTAFENPSHKIILSGHLERLNNQKEVTLNPELQELFIRSETEEKVDLPPFSGEKMNSLFLDLKNLESFDQSFRHFPSLKEIDVRHLSSDMDLTRFKNLRKLTAEQGSKSDQPFNIKYSDNKNLKEIKITWFYNVLDINDLPENVEEVNFDKCFQVKDLITDKTFNTLRNLIINPIDGKIKLKDGVLPQKIDLQHENFPVLETVIIHSRTVNYVSPNIIKFKKLKLYNNYSGEGYNKYLQYFNINNSKNCNELFTSQEKEALYYFITAEDKSEVTVKHRQNFFSLYQKYISDLHQYFDDNYYSINPEHKKIEEFDLIGKKKKVIFLGNTSSTKTLLKEDAKLLNWQPTIKVENADIIVLGEKYKFKNLPKVNAIFCTENEFLEIRKKEVPRYLEKDDKENDMFIENLQALLESNSPENELIGLELIKTGGLPDALKGDAYFISNHSLDTKVRAKFRKFLKGYTDSDDDKKWIRSENYISRLYKKDNSTWLNGLKFIKENKALRKEIIDKHLFNEVSRRPSTLGHRFALPLFKEEIEYVLSHRMFGDKLVRINLYLHDVLTEKIFDFPNIKHVYLSNLNMTDFKNLVCKLHKIQELLIGTLDEIPTEIVALKNLKKFRFSWSEEIEKVVFPQEIYKLKKLDSVVYKYKDRWLHNWKDYQEG